MTDRKPTKVLTYCRVSTTKQKDGGNGLEPQDMRHRQYAQSTGYEIEAVFPDRVSGGGDFMNRPGMVALLSYLDAQRETSGHVVIFDDLKRFARDYDVRQNPPIKTTKIASGAFRKGTGRRGRRK